MPIKICGWKTNQKYNGVKERVILAPLKKEVNKINTKIVDLGGKNGKEVVLVSMTQCKIMQDDHRI